MQTSRATICHEQIFQMTAIFYAIIMYYLDVDGDEIYIKGAGVNEVILA
jgi:hypothetical protein